MGARTINLASALRAFADRLEVFEDNDPRLPGNVAVILGRIKQLIRDRAEGPRLTTIAGVTATHCDITIGKMLSRCRKQHVAFARQLAMYLCRELTDKSFPEIAEFFHRDHSTAIHAWNMIKERAKGSPQFAESVEQLRQALTAGKYSEEQAA